MRKRGHACILMELVITLSVSIYDPLTCDKFPTFPLSPTVNISRKAEQKGHLEVIHAATHSVTRVHDVEFNSGSQGGFWEVHPTVRTRWTCSTLPLDDNWHSRTRFYTFIIYICVFYVRSGVTIKCFLSLSLSLSLLSLSCLSLLLVLYPADSQQEGSSL